MVSAATSKHATGAGACAQCGDLVRAQWSILYRATLVARCVCPCLSGLQLVRFRSVGAARMVSTSNSKHKTGAGACAQFGERPRAQRSILYRATPWSHGVCAPACRVCSSCVSGPSEQPAWFPLQIASIQPGRVRARSAGSDCVRSGPFCFVLSPGRTVWCAPACRDCTWRFSGLSEQPARFTQHIPCM